MSNINNKAWFNKYDPESLEQYLFEQEEHRDIVNSWFNTDNIDGNIILSSKKGGTGKTSLMRILTKRFIKNFDNIVRADGSVKNMREDIFPILKLPPIKDRKRFIILNEFEGGGKSIYSTNTLNFLKDRCLENFQDNNVFIATTNNINSIPEPVLQRFTYKFNFTGKHIPKNLIQKCIHILNSENVKFDKKDVIEYLKKVYEFKSLREIINDLQIFSQGGIFKVKMISYSQTGFEEEIIGLTLNIFRKLMTSNNLEEKRICLSFPKNTFISKEWTRLIEILDQNLDYEYVYIMISEKLSGFIPVFEISRKYANDYHLKKYKYVDYLSYVRDCMESILVISDINLFSQIKIE